MKQRIQRPALARLGHAVAVAALCAASLTAQAAPCTDEPPTIDAGSTPQANIDARRMLSGLLEQAMARTQALGTARLLTEAAQADLEEARASPLPRVTLSGSAIRLNQNYSFANARDTQRHMDVSVSAPLFDAGRTAATVHWRERLLEAARHGELDAREQIALQTVSLAMERQRYQRHAEVYGRYAARMGCLVGALEKVVAADRGRASELLQSRNTLRQAELALAQAQSLQRQMESRLRRFVGETLPPPVPLEALLENPPALEPTLDAAARASAIEQLSAQAEAQEHLARVVRAGYLPQLNWSLSGSRTDGLSPVTGWSGGISLSMPLVDATAEPAQRAARQRAEAARLQRDDTLAARLQRVAETHEQARAAFERAKASVEVLQGSQRVREATLLQWQQLGRRSLFDVISSESEYHNLQITRVNALLDAQEAVALLWSLGMGLQNALQ